MDVVVRGSFSVALRTKRLRKNEIAACKSGGSTPKRTFLDSPHS